MFGRRNAASGYAMRSGDGDFCSLRAVRMGAKHGSAASRGAFECAAGSISCAGAIHAGGPGVSSSAG